MNPEFQQFIVLHPPDDGPQASCFGSRTHGRASMPPVGDVHAPPRRSLLPTAALLLAFTGVGELRTVDEDRIRSDPAIFAVRGNPHRLRTGRM